MSALKKNRKREHLKVIDGLRRENIDLRIKMQVLKNLLDQLCKEFSDQPSKK